MHKPRKRFGQNFLKSPYILEQIAGSIPGPSNKAANIILEIGPGQGALTTYLLKQSRTVHAIEIDRDLVEYLKNKYKSLLDKNFYIYENDVLEVNLESLCSAQQISHVIGNLPYNISTPFLLKYVRECPKTPASFLIQKEVADRLIAPCGSRDYGRLSLAIQHAFDVTKVCDVGPENFFPAPQVQSQVVLLSPKATCLERAPLFQVIVDQAFQQRRKTLRNALSRWDIPFKSLNIDPSRRPETLSEEEFDRIATHASPKTPESF